MKTSNQHITGLLFLILSLLLVSCERQGPMGPEGPQGPDGPPGAGGGGGGEGGSSLITFVSPPNANVRWEDIDGWGGYTIGQLEGTGITIPDKYLKTIEEGLVTVYLGDSEGDWYKLPWSTGAKKEQIYDYAFMGTELWIQAKIKNDDNGSGQSTLMVSKVKVVIAPAAKVHRLSLVD